MRFTDYVDIPEELLEAHLEGKLVFFAGAGVSISPPSGLPSFRTLTENICRRLSTTLALETGIDPTIEGVRKSSIPFDQILEKLERGAQIRDLVRAEIEVEGSKPNKLHRAIFKLANLRPEPKIVTTNFDSHFNTLNRDSGAYLREYAAPALPLGRSFKGIVQIHGSTSPNSDPIVLTRKDFGAAYLVDGWARDFLYEMFREHLVLFVGYSHDDLMLDYFARGMSGENRRYILINSEKKRDWTELGIIPIYYPLTEGGEHLHLDDAIESWANVASSGALEVKTRLADLSQNPVFPLSPKDHDFLVHALKGEASSINFYNRAQFLSWSKWIEEQGFFNILFSANVIPKENFPLLDWFARACVASPESSSAAFNMVASHADGINPWLWTLIVESLARDDLLNQSMVDSWTSWLLLEIPKSGGRALGNLLHAYDFATSPNVALQLFKALVKLQLELTPSYQRDSNVVSLPLLQIDDGDADDGMYMLEHFWNREKLSLPTEVVWQLISLIHKNFEEASDTFQGFYGDVQVYYDMVATLGYFALREGEPSHVTKFSILADVATVSLKRGFRENAKRAINILNMWVDSNIPVLQIIAFIFASGESSFTANEVALLIVERDLLLNLHLNDRISEFLRLQFDALSAEVKTKIVEMLNPTLADDDKTLWMKGRLAEGLLAEFSNETSLKLLMDSLIVAMPELANASDGYFPHGRFRIANDEPIRPVEAYLLEIRQDPSKILKEIMEISRNHDHFLHPNVNDVTFTLSECVRRDANSAQILWEEIDGLTDNDLRITLLSALLEPFDSICAQGHSIVLYLDLIQRLRSTKLLERSISKTLLEIAKPWERNINLEFESRVHEVLRELVNSHSETQIDVKGGSEAYSEVINDACGNLVELYLRVLQSFAVKDAQGFISADDDRLIELSVLIEGTGGHFDLRYSRLGLSIQFLIQLAPDWVERYLMPRVRCEVTDSTVLATWSGFLHSGMKSDWLIAKNVIQGYQVMLSRRLELGEYQYGHLVQRIAWLASFSPLSIDALSWVLPMIVENRERTEFMTAWNSAIERILQANDDIERERIWSCWLGKYVSERTQSLPVNATRFEKAEIACWTPHTGTLFLRFIAQVLKSPGFLSAHLSLYITDEKDSIFKEYPSESMKFVTALLNQTRPTDSQNPWLYDFAKELEGAVTADEYRSLIDAAVLAGYYEATEWDN